jgi:transcriptional regulator of acetoin/glycerol metabolism
VGPGVAAAELIRHKLDQVGGYFQRIDRPAMRAQVQAVRAQLHVEEGLGALAREKMEQAGQAFQQQRRPDRLVDALLAFSRTLRRKGRDRDAIHYLQWAHREAVRAGRPWLARTVIEHLGAISERAVMDLVGPPVLAVDRSETDVVVRAANSLENSRSPAMQELVSSAGAVAPTDETVLIQGATGSGKEVVARYIHLNSRRSQGKFLACNCGALTETLLESEFFGHEAGVFTDAKEDRLGLFEAAAGGTVFLDEVGELSPQGQVTLLRFLQDHAVRPVGSHKPRPVNVRIIAATNRDLRAEVREGKFREDLYYRLAVYDLALPALRERREDFPGLCDQLLSNIAQAQGKGVKSIGEPVMRKLRAHTWPGNVRELDNVLRSAVIRCKGTRVLKRDLPPSLDLAPLTSESFPTLAKVERAHIDRALELCSGNKKKAAELLGIHRNTLANKLKNG